MGRVAVLAGLVAAAVVVVVLVAGLGGSADDEGPVATTRAVTTTGTPVAARPVPLDRLAGAMVIAGVSRADGPGADLLRAVRAGRVGGVIVADTGPADGGTLARRLQGAARAGGRGTLLVTTDQEGGLVRRWTDLPPAQSAAELARLGEAATGDIAQRTGCALAANGVNLDLAPVADAATDPGGFIAREGRAFATSSAAALPYVAAFVRGLHRGGVGATLKHFPGLGSTVVTTDEDTAARSPDPGSVAAFTAAIGAGADAVMVASATYARGRFATGAPAVASRTVLARLRSLGFDGPIVTDALDAPGIARNPALRDIAVDAVRAGADLLLYAQPGGAAPERARRALVAAVRAGTIPRARLTQAWDRIAALKRALATSARGATCASG